ncbi:MAG: GTPase HflX [Cyclobacteriaceae bacterium]|jgi:GTP-binding protein HflX
MFKFASEFESKMGKKAILVALITGRQTEDLMAEHLAELAFLAQTAGIDASREFIQKLPHPDNRTFVGKGKLAEIRAEVMADASIGHVIFDDDLSASQLRNLEKEFNPTDREVQVRVYDRSLLILDIFLMRAQTAQARTQVALARNQYLLPRLTRLWTHLERQRGGTGTRGGAGEKEIETDRRNIRHQIKLLKEELEVIDRQRATQRKGRAAMVRVALVGYTNVGKSTLMNLLAKTEVKAEDKLFATVDATVRKVVLGDVPFLLSDTVGFIRKLPHHLIESFKSTLDEVREADILLHVVDVSHPYHENQIEVVHKTLQEIGAGEVPVILVLNKIDKAEAEQGSISWVERQAHYRQWGAREVIFISAVARQRIAELKKMLYHAIREKHMQLYPNFLKTETYDYGF